MCVGQNGTFWDTGKGYYQLVRIFGTELRLWAVAISMNFRAKRGACNNLQQFATENKRCFSCWCRQVGAFPHSSSWLRYPCPVRLYHDHSQSP